MKQLFFTAFCLFNLTVFSQSITNITPANGQKGSVYLPITITGSGTSFSNATSTIIEIKQGTSTLIIDNANVISATQVDANISIPNVYPTGAYDVRVYDQNNGLIEALGAFTVSANPTPPSSIHVTPEVAGATQTLPITISMQNANFTQGTSTIHLTQGTSTIINPIPGSTVVLNDNFIRATFDLASAGIGSPDSLYAHAYNSFDGSFTAPNLVYTLPVTTVVGSINYPGSYSGLVEVYQQNAGMTPPTYSYVGNSYVVGNSFSIPNIPLFTTYLLRSVPVGMTDVVATYYQNNVAWQNSTSLFELSGPQTMSYVITPFSSIIAAQQGITVNGALGYGPNGFFKANAVMAPDVEVFLKDVNNSLYMQTVTNSNGEYSFANLPNGDYEIVIDIPGYEQISTYSFNVNAASQDIFDLDFLIDNGEIFISDFMSLEDNAQDYLNIYPNPSNGTIFIELPDTKGAIEIGVRNLNGRQVYLDSIVGGNNKLELNLSALSAGIYFVELKYKEGHKFTKLMISK